MNIGLQTAVEFLKKKADLGSVKDEMTTNTKISDEQYDALVNEFSTDKDVKTKAEMLFSKKTKEKKVEKKIVAAEELLEPRQQLKTVGKIDLDSIGKPKATTKPSPPAPRTSSPPPCSVAPFFTFTLVHNQPIHWTGRKQFLCFIP